MKRQTCSDCKRPIKFCYCSHIEQVKNKTEIIILQHPLECKHPFNTARICEKTFDNCNVLVGEDFNTHLELQEILSQKKCALLFKRQDSLRPNPVQNRNNIECLIVIDGNWKKAKKIYYLNTFLHDLPLIEIESNYPMNYQIRRYPKKGHYATVEAITYALTEQEGTDFTVALKAFQYMAAVQSNLMASKL